MTPLAAILARRIAAAGPLTVAEFMAEALMHPDHGYYATHDPFGAGGDFTTAPEISQMFGELIGLALAQAWRDQGAPGRIVLAELGPGRGTLMADALRATRGMPGFHAALSVHFVETSPALRAVQARAVPDAIWHDHADALPDAPLFLVANEFFDALPVRQFLRAGDGWAERRVTTRDGALGFALSAPLPVPALDRRLDLPEGTMVELCPALPAIASGIAARIVARGGAALILDYGGWDGTGDTLQAVKSHAFTDPLAEPGEADLTAHVDFAALAGAARAAGAQVSPMVTQGAFLERLGITARARALAQGPAAGAVAAAHRRLTHPDQMGHLFKAIGFAPPGAPSLPGLSA